MDPTRFSMQKVQSFAESINGNCSDCGRILTDYRGVLATHSDTRQFHYAICCDDECAKHIGATTEKNEKCFVCWTGYVTGNRGRETCTNGVKFYEYKSDACEVIFLCCSEKCLLELKECIEGKPKNRNSSRSRTGQKVPQKKSHERELSTPTHSGAIGVGDTATNTSTTPTPLPKKSNQCYDALSCAHCHRKCESAITCPTCFSRLCSVACSDSHDLQCDQPDF